MLKRFLQAVGIVVLAGALILGLGIGMERLGDWTDAHPEYRLIAWSAWNAGVIVAAVLVTRRWMRYRRARAAKPGAPAV
jgi:hypothetical protein